MGSASVEPVVHERTTRSPRDALHVVQLSFYLDPQRRGPLALLEAWPSLVDVAEATAECGARVSVVQACSEHASIVHNRVSYRFVAPPAGSDTIATSPALAELLRELEPDVIHVHGLGFAHDLSRLAKLLPTTPILVQDHANRLPRPWHRPRWRRALSNAAAIAFCAREQAEPFVKAGVIGARTRIYAIPECSSRFMPGDRTGARAATGLYGDPCVLWVGHLDDNKDPLSVLDGIALAAAELPNLHLWCCFGTAPLLPKVMARVDLVPHLRERVHLLGRVPHERIELLMHAADLFVLGSHREGSGYALIEALACGLPPIVTDIPSFRTLTGHGAIGALWPCGDGRQLARALTRCAVTCGPTGRASVRAHFDREVSFDALGRKLIHAYEEMLGRGPRSRSIP